MDITNTFIMAITNIILYPTVFKCSLFYDGYNPLLLRLLCRFLHCGPTSLKYYNILWLYIMSTLGYFNN